ncbi:hypothetical protein [Chryseobacterium gambrini]|uniref:Uncharacterized protein n=1 Tax=Chryseobacterium gambrini TaxID=373672 RepID=A0A1N7KM79_9FLAO|nr:hypothetical protein [Chryseobacterium gambrini]SIS62742.1 hypothetical protein SAMN05421785_101602 [Chryseobacterium gambrini]
MKKLIFAFCMILLCSSQIVMAQSKAKTKVQTTNSKESMLKSLKNIMVKGMVASGTPKAKTEKFADCFTKDLGEKLTPEELVLFYKLNTLKNGPEKEKLTKQGEKMGMPAKMETVGKDCAVILQ